MRTIIAGALAAAALAVSGCAAASAPPAQPNRTTVRSLERAIVTGESVTIDGRTYAARLCSSLHGSAACR